MGFVFVIYVLYVINVIKVRPSAGWALCYISLFMVLCLVRGPSAGWVRCFTFPYIPVTFLLCLKILQACNVFITPVFITLYPVFIARVSAEGLI